MSAWSMSPLPKGLHRRSGSHLSTIARGDQFERSLFYREGELILESLIEKEVLPPGAEALIDLRLRMNGHPDLSSG